MPKTIATVSTAKIPFSSGFGRTNRKPSAIARSPGRATAPSGGILGSSSAATSEAVNVTTSIA